MEIWWFHFEERFIITGTPGRRDWYANVLANPRVVIETRLETSGTAAPVSDEQFRHRFFSDTATRWYSTQAELGPGEDRPMIELDLDECLPSATSAPWAGYRLPT